ncbi:MAG: DNA-directed DNA polymerase I, partial [Candidatus Bathyarchaeia archaeon]
YDSNLEMGMPYQISNGKLKPLEYTPSRELLEQIEQLFGTESTEFRQFVQRWVKLLECPVPNLRYAAIDIEVGSPESDRVPDPREAKHPIICVSVTDTADLKKVMLLRRPGLVENETQLPDVDVKYFDREIDLIREISQVLSSYPIVVTFNGDDFDLRYIWHRAAQLGIHPEDLPIELGREFALLSSGIHIDLYRFFFNRAIQIYAFDQKYRENTLNDLSVSLLGRGKIKLPENISKLSYSMLAEYCLRDSELTYELTSFDDHLIMKLMIAIARLCKMPLEDVTRQGVSNWIRSMMFAEHRRRNFLIPTRDEIGANKTAQITSEAIIKGKKYRGGTVIDPKPGVNFNVAVLDFSSLYPSIIKRHNLSYETVLCPHPECKSNVIPETASWVCTRKQGLSSLMIGSLRDLRVKWYKQKAKDKQLPAPSRAWYSVVQRTLKVILNASYGVFGAEPFALYCLPVAEATAAIGRFAITSAIAKSKELGVEVIYGDTDSVFLKQPTDSQIQQLVEWSRLSLGMELDAEKAYRYTVFSTRKKNYIGVYPDGSVDIKGLTGKKRNTPTFLKNAFADMVNSLSAVNNERDFRTTIEKITTIVKDCHSKLKNRQYTLEQLAFTVVLGKGLDDYDKTTPQHVKVLQNLSRADRENIGAGSVIRFVKTRREPGVRLLSQASLDEIDTGKYLEHLQSTFEPVSEALEIDFNNIVGVSRLEGFLQ